tara:strand:+ start:582 stop:1931 length:1350 start_codon:yes stop_codon:yes gene_type:complete
MARDLYGEMLARTLNRGAPPGHSAAYITPQEGFQLRASGGGVAPGGGQYMANGIPSFQEFGGVDPGIDDPTGPTGGYGSAGFEMGFADPGLPGYSEYQGVSRADVDRAVQDLGPENPLGKAERNEMARQMAAARRAAVAPPEALHEIAARNLEAINRNPDYVEHRGPPAGYRGQPAAPPTYTEKGREALSRSISKGGIGSEAPGTALANNNPTATTEDVATVNQHSDRTGGYSVNDPYSDVSVPAGMNMGMIPALAGTVAGLASPAIGLPMMMSEYPTLGRMGWNAARADTGMIGTALRGFETNVTDPINRAFDVVTAPVDRLGDFLGSRVRAGASAVGDFIDENVVDPLGQRTTALGEDIAGAFPDLPDFSIGDVFSQGETPSGSFQDPQAGGNQEVFVPPQPAPVTEPFVSDSTERQFADIPPEILARILANEQFGRQRQQQALGLA